MSNLNKGFQRLGEALEEARRAFGALATELELTDGAMKQARRDLEDGRKREAELREILRDRGLASYDNNDQRRPNNESGN